MSPRVWLLPLRFLIILLYFLSFVININLSINLVYSFVMTSFCGVLVGAAVSWLRPWPVNLLPWVIVHSSLKLLFSLLLISIWIEVRFELWGTKIESPVISCWWQLLSTFWLLTHAAITLRDAWFHRRTIAIVSHLQKVLITPTQWPVQITTQEAIRWSTINLAEPSWNLSILYWVIFTT
jgi:hypothetical protein